MYRTNNNYWPAAIAGMSPPLIIFAHLCAGDLLASNPSIHKAASNGWTIAMLSAATQQWWAQQSPDVRKAWSRISRADRRHYVMSIMRSMYAQKPK